MAHVIRCYPEAARQLGADLEEAVGSCISGARTYGFAEEREICRYINLVFRFGCRFDTASECGWAHALLRSALPGAFVATLWGVMSANVMWLPLASRLKRVSELECQQMELVVEGILAIQSGTNPRVVKQKLDSLLPPGATAKEAA